MRLFKTFVFLMMVWGLTACGGGGGSPGQNPNQTTLVTTAPDTLVLQSGAPQTYKISGGTPPYSAASPNPAAVSAAVSGTSLVLTGLNTSATAVAVEVRDSVGTKITINTTVVGAGGSTPVALFTTASAGVTLRVGASADYVVGGGATPYLAPSSSNPAVAIATLTDGTLKIIGVSSGTATITVRDSANATVSAAVTVRNLDLIVNPATAAGTVGDRLQFSVSGGVPFGGVFGAQSYSLINGNPSLVSASISGGTVSVNLLAAGTATLTVTDSEAKAATLTVTVSNAVPTFRMSPSALTISEDYATAIPLLITGGTAPYTVFSSNSTIVPTPTVSGSAVSVGGAFAGGKRCVAATTAITITAVDANGFTATTTLNVNDTGVACP